MSWVISGLMARLIWSLGWLFGMRQRIRRRRGAGRPLHAPRSFQLSRALLGSSAFCELHLAMARLPGFSATEDVDQDEDVEASQFYGRPILESRFLC